MPEKFRPTFSDYFGEQPAAFGMSELAGDYIVIFCHRVQRSELDLLECGPLKERVLGRDGKIRYETPPGLRAAVIEFDSRRLHWRLIASADPFPMFELRFQAKGCQETAWNQPYYSRDHELYRLDEAWEVVERSEAEPSP